MKEHDATIPKVPLWKVLQLNAKEWPLLLLGAVGSIFEGATFPMFAIIIGEILRVCEHNYECYLHDRVVPSSHPYRARHPTCFGVIAMSGVLWRSGTAAEC